MMTNKTGKKKISQIKASCYQESLLSNTDVGARNNSYLKGYFVNFFFFNKKVKSCYMAKYISLLKTVAYQIFQGFP